MKSTSTAASSLMMISHWFEPSGLDVGFTVEVSPAGTCGMSVVGGLVFLGWGNVLKLANAADGCCTYATHSNVA